VQVGSVTVFCTFTSTLLCWHPAVVVWQGRGHERCHINFEGCDWRLCCASLFRWTSEGLWSDPRKVIWCYWKWPQLSVSLCMVSCVASSGCVVPGKVFYPVAQFTAILCDRYRPKSCIHNIEQMDFSLESLSKMCHNFIPTSADTGTYFPSRVFSDFIPLWPVSRHSGIYDLLS